MSEDRIRIEYIGIWTEPNVSKMCPRGSSFERKSREVSSRTLSSGAIDSMIMISSKIARTRPHADIPGFVDTKRVEI